MSSTRTTWILDLVDRVSKPMRTITKAGQRAEATTKRVDTSLGRLKKQALGAFGVLQLFRGVQGIAKLGLDAEQTDIKFGVLLGSVEKATTLINDINKFADKTPFDNAALKKNAELLLNFGIAGNKVIPSLKMLGDVSGGQKEKLNSLTLAYAQVQSAGKLMGQDLLQMINAGFNPLQIMSEKTGKSIGFFKDQMSKGNISAEMVTETLKSATGAGGRFNNMLEKISESGTGKISTFFGNLKTKIAEFSKVNLVPTVKKIFQFGTDVVNNFSKVGTAIYNLLQPIKPVFTALFNLLGLITGVGKESFTAGNAIETLTSIINFIAIPIEIMANGVLAIINFLKPFSGLLKGVAIGYGIWTAAQWALNFAMTANPIGLVIAAIAALVGGIIYAYEKVAWFRGGIDAIWVTLKGFGNAIKELVINRIMDFVKGITGLGKTLMLFFKGEWKQAYQTGKQATKDLLGVNSAKKAVNQFKQVGKDAAQAYASGVNAVKTAKLNINAKTTAEAVLNKNTSASPGLNPATALNLDGGGNGSGSAKGISGGGAGKNITQNLNITNHFTVDKNARESLENLADMLAGRLNDKLRDGLIALQ